MPHRSDPPRTPVRVNTAQLEAIEKLAVKAVSIEGRLYERAEILDRVLALGIAEMTNKLEAQEHEKGNKPPE